MPRLTPLRPTEDCRVQFINVPDRATPGHVAVFIEARDADAVLREIYRLGGAVGVLRAVFAEPMENARGTFTAHGFLAEDPELAVAAQKVLAGDLPSSRCRSKRI